MRFAESTEKRIAQIVKRRDAGTVGLREQNAAVRCVRVRKAAQNMMDRPGLEEVQSLTPDALDVKIHHRTVVWRDTMA
jgi:hypothetical protein